MSPVRIKPRQLSKPCRVCGKTRHQQVVFKMGGRGFPELTAGSFHYEKDARARRDFVAGELAAGRNPIESLRAVTAMPAAPARLDEIAERYKASRIDYADGSARGAAAHLNRLIPLLGADRDPATITVTDCIDVVARLADELKPASIVKYMTTLKMLLDYAGVDPNPARNRLVKLPQVEHVEPAPPTADHVVAILDRVSASMRLCLITLEQTGMAIGETCMLEWSDVDVPGRRFRLRREKVKGRIASRARWVQVPEWLMGLLEQTCPAEDRLDGRRVFPDATPERAQRAMERACRAAEIPKFTPHDLRHRRLSLWHGQGVPAKELAARAGHTRASITLDTYSHVMPLDEVDQEQLLALAVRGGAR